MLCITLPSPDVYARHAATGLTSYTLAEVEAALVECRAADAEWQAAAARAWDVLAANIDYYLLPGPSCPIYSERVAGLLAVVEREVEPVIQTGSTSNDMFPIKAWLAKAKAARASAKRIERAIEKAVAATAA